MKFVKKQNAFGWVLMAGAVLALIGLIVYIVNSTTGYIAGEPVNAIPIVLPILSILGAVALWLYSEKLDDRITGVATFVLAVLMAISIVMLLVARIDVMGDLLNPIEHSAAQIKTVNVAIIAIVFNALSFVAFVVTTIAGRLHKEI